MLFMDSPVIKAHRRGYSLMQCLINHTCEPLFELWNLFLFTPRETGQDVCLRKYFCWFSNSHSETGKLICSQRVHHRKDSVMSRCSSSLLNFNHTEGKIKIIMHNPDVLWRNSKPGS